VLRQHGGLEVACAQVQMDGIGVTYQLLHLLDPRVSGHV
jgi:hypothetical protein